MKMEYKRKERREINLTLDEVTNNVGGIVTSIEREFITIIKPGCKIKLAVDNALAYELTRHQVNTGDYVNITVVTKATCVCTGNDTFIYSVFANNEIF